jgi:hypothetical protein
MAIERAEAACRHGRGRILVFARAPYPGRVKRRLIPVYGKRGAARLYRLMLRDTLGAVTGLAPLELWCEPNTNNAFLRDCARQAGAKLRVQRGRDLGQRMYHAFEDVLRTAPWALVVGSDCVSLSRPDLEFACAALDQGRDAVLGPAEDGGYVLLGLRRPERALFQFMPWGTCQILARTRRQLARLDYDWTELPLRWDADRPREIRRWRAIRGSSRWRSDRT